MGGKGKAGKEVGGVREGQVQKKRKGKAGKVTWVKYTVVKMFGEEAEGKTRNEKRPYAEAYPNVPPEVLVGGAVGGGQGAMEQFLAPKLVKGELRAAIAKFVVMSGSSFRVVDCYAPNVIPSCWTVACDVTRYADMARALARAELELEEEEVLPLFRGTTRVEKEKYAALRLSDDQWAALVAALPVLQKYYDSSTDELTVATFLDPGLKLVYFAMDSVPTVA
ncbi:unnamed protein product [Closterium sp. Naga37s-1]|nr:unnamed protein product [Closterium sp. Naga37s-1]